MSKAKFEVERTQFGEVELDLDLVNSTSSVKDAIKEAADQGLVKWKDVSAVKILSINVDAYMAKCYEEEADEPYNLIVLAESKENAVSLIEDYMAGITSSEYTIKLSKADKRDVAQYINDENAFNFESVIEIEEVARTLNGDDPDFEY